jgi:uncharacterized protein
MPPLSLLIKPASSNCNLKCKYCFYHSIAENRVVPSYGMMDNDTLETLVSKALRYADYSCTFAFQGGEPTLVGLDFYRKLIELIKTYNVKNIDIHYAIQTNGLLINDEWARFLAQNKFLVGISLDGTKNIHDSMRIDARGRGSFNGVMNTVNLFNKYGVEFNILTVVNSFVARHIIKIYNFFKKSNFRYLQFIPCLDPLDQEPGNFEYSLTPERYSYFLKALFDLWYQDILKNNIISIRYFDNLVGMILGYRPEACGMSGECTCYFVIEANGGVYPCDFYVLDKWYLGNIKDTGFGELSSSPKAIEFVESSKHIDPECPNCKWYSLCRGGCRRNREPFIDGKPALNYFCSSYKEFFEYAVPKLYEIAYSIKSNSRSHF